MTEDEFAELTVRYIAATEARLTLIKADHLTDAETLRRYRDIADQEWELGLAWDAELLRSAEE